MVIIVTLAVYLLKYVLLTGELTREKLNIETKLGEKELTLVKASLQIKHLKASKQHSEKLNTKLKVENSSKVIQKNQASKEKVTAFKIIDFLLND